ncbi:hypothetical protein LNKW23_35880 [Paralimibaculum aggregatum]|uniref:Rhodanese domain-containing protein n=1 Tax=Paralimibaculum aggregatum TaxID=3036245 RepID=A0ABQ6LR69_9RHOB|nr:rhodanese-like domain-containing protein [Limibaculum sp. NKW23]GMG84373.1 hypothetical protein LNKW23_35880 [Limibaculum sp. NKW23]
MDHALPSATPAEALAAQAGGAVLVDLRKPVARIASGQTIRGAVTRDPFAFGHDDPLTASAAPVILFCVHGHEVSQYGCALLLLHGRQARYVTGGFAALVEAGAPLVPLAAEEHAR